ncbi:LamG domain-containing protein [Acinetobacter schindleri]|uniref:LamG domain-containing protein n=1 Tax=Acinetobacter schindleri TaxID=108981 RepID=UPI003F5488C0
MTNRLELNWKLDGFIDEQRYYCSETPIDPLNLPLPKAILAGDVRTYIDTDIEIAKTYYVRVGSVKNGIEKISSLKTIMTSRDQHWPNVIARLTFADFTDNTGRVWTPTDSPQISSSGVFGSCLDLSSGGYLNCGASTDLYLDSDFTIEFWMNCTGTANGYLILASNQRGSWSNGIAAVNYQAMYSRVVLYNHESGIFEITNVEKNEWVHICFSRTNGVLRTYKNGVLQNTYNNNRVYPFNTNGTYLGRDTWNADGVSDFKGYIDDLRITKGVGRYVEVGFSPSSGPLPIS